MILSLITKDSVERVGGVFTRVLESTLQLPYSTIILVDDSESGRTRDVVRRFAAEHNKELIIMRSRLYGYHKPTRATARQTAIDTFLEGSNDDWLFFIDDDAVLNEGWWGWVQGRLSDKTGLVWGINWDASPRRRRYLEALGVNYEEYLISAFRRRGGTHDTMLRREAIMGVRIPPELHVYEDAWIYHYVVCGGWDALINPIGVTHYGEGSPFDPKLMVTAAKYGIVEYDKQGLLGLLRPILGYLPMAWVMVRLEGVRGLVTAARRQWLKILVRYYALKVGDIPDVCSVVRG